MNLRCAILLFAVLVATAVAQENPAQPQSATNPLDSLDAVQMQKAIDALRQTHVRGPSLDATALTRATLRGLLESLSPGAELAGAEPAIADAPFRSEILDGRAGYIRLGSLSAQNLGQLDTALRDFTENKVHGVVLDLRATPETTDFALAAQAAGRFVPAGTALFSLAGSAPGSDRDFVSEGEPLFRGVIVVIVDVDTAGAAEALAATLRWNARALLVGARTSGRCVEFSLVPLSGEHQMRIASAEVRVAGQPVYPRGLRPDIEVAQDDETRDAILEEALEKGMAPFVFETERAKLNEAALVAGTNPEIDSEPSMVGLVDRPLQRAVDLVTAIKLFRNQD